MNDRTTRWDRRDKKRHKERHGMKISGRSLLTVVDTQRKRANKLRRLKDEEVQNDG